MSSGLHGHLYPHGANILTPTHKHISLEFFNPSFFNSGKSLLSIKSKVVAKLLKGKIGTYWYLDPARTNSENVLH